MMWVSVYVRALLVKLLSKYRHLLQKTTEEQFRGQILFKSSWYGRSSMSLCLVNFLLSEQNIHGNLEVKHVSDHTQLKDKNLHLYLQNRQI